MENYHFHFFFFFLFKKKKKRFCIFTFYRTIIITPHISFRLSVCARVCADEWDHEVMKKQENKTPNHPSEGNEVIGEIKNFNDSTAATSMVLRSSEPTPANEKKKKPTKVAVVSVVYLSFIVFVISFSFTQMVYAYSCYLFWYGWSSSSSSSLLVYVWFVYSVWGERARARARSLVLRFGLRLIINIEFGKQSVGHKIRLLADVFFFSFPHSTFARVFFLLFWWKKSRSRTPLWIKFNTSFSTVHPGKVLVTILLFFSENK